MVKNHTNFINSEIFRMNLYLSLCRVAGDTRDENEIFIEWIQDNAESFRNDFVAVHNA